MTERTYTLSDLALNQAALILEVVNLANALIKIGRERGLAGYAICDDLLDDLHAIPTDQPALAKHDAELLAREVEARSRVLLANENLRAEIAKLKAETAAMLEKVRVEFDLHGEELEKFRRLSRSAGGDEVSTQLAIAS